MSKKISLPILYSLRNCPFAMRARMSLFCAQQSIILRNIVLSDKPAHMLTLSPKGTVPVLVVNDTSTSGISVIDESLDIMIWSLQQSDPGDLMLNRLVANKTDTAVNGSIENTNDIQQEMMTLISLFDTGFKTALEQYKCAKRYHESSLQQKRVSCESYIKPLEARLSKHEYIMADIQSLADIALLPFIRQFAKVERQWYLQSPYPKVRAWLNRYLQSTLFTQVMAQHPLWSPDQQPLIFPKR